MNFMEFQGPGFTMMTPTDWMITSSLQFQALFLAPSDSGGFNANLAVSIRRITDDVTVLSVAESTKDTQSNEYDQYEVLEEVDYTRKGGLAFLRKYRWLQQDNQIGVVQTQAFLVAGTILFTLTGSRSEDSPDGEALDGIFLQMIESFRVQQT